MKKTVCALLLLSISQYSFSMSSEVESQLKIDRASCDSFYDYSVGYLSVMIGMKSKDPAQNIPSKLLNSDAVGNNALRSSFFTTIVEPHLGDLDSMFEKCCTQGSLEKNWDFFLKTEYKFYLKFLVEKHNAQNRYTYKGILER